MGGAREEQRVPVVRETTAGRVGGVQYRPSGFALWRGIPYGTVRPDGGRFAGPVRPEPWERVRPALRHGRMSWQLPPVHDRASGGPRDFGFAHTADPEHEDCLNLDVYTPDPGRAGLPVLVWFHPGMQVAGSGNMPGRRPEVLSRNHGVVVVTMNFRLGCWGHLFLDELGGPGGPVGRDTANLRLRDQVLALAWVKENIAAFGGDAANVTLFGESAGARNIGSVLGCPAAEGLFERAALYSGGCENVVPRDAATAFAREFLECAGLTDAPGRLLTIPNVHLRLAHERLLERHEIVHYRDVVDGTHLERPPIEAIAAGASGKTDLLVSHTADEAGLWDRLMPDGARVVARGARTGVPAARYGTDHAAFINAELFLRPARELLRTKSASGGGRCWYQVYDHVPSNHSFADAPRAVHGMDLASLLLDLSCPGSASEADVTVARHVQGALVEFARGRGPATGQVPWPVYDRTAELLVRIGPEPRVESAVWPPDDDHPAAGR
ncbi:carboxylesterase family protein [Streptomyces sp. NPDC058195]|uniref:carboxylesterase family protein n=1 Tax=Streptomyces sp. NPDC058195 TaxID=3346375 RepID=UPI0036ED7224